MEHPNVKGYDYEKVREKMLRSWGKTTGAVPEKKEKTDNEVQPEKKFFKVKNKSVKIKTGSNDLTKTGSNDLTTGSENLTREKRKTFSAKKQELKERNSSIFTSSFKQSLKQGNTGMKEHSGATEKAAFPGSIPDPRQWVIYDALFGPARFRRPWKPFK